MNYMEAYYYKSAEILKEHLPCIPKLQLTYGKSYYGRIQVSTDNIIIRLSRHNLFVSEWLRDQEDIDELLDTICHEFAHLLFWNHDEDHKETTQLFLTLVKSNLEIERLKYLLKTS